VPIEAQAAGLPVIAYGRGGVRDSVVHRRTGLLYDDPTVDALADAIIEFDSLELDESAIRDNARRFSPGHFRAGMVAALESLGKDAILA
jgi:glycosyltransferase involved in cell wall biosynthesis